MEELRFKPDIKSDAQTALELYSRNLPHIFESLEGAIKGEKKRHSNGFDGSDNSQSLLLTVETYDAAKKAAHGIAHIAKHGLVTTGPNAPAKELLRYILNFSRHTASLSIKGDYQPILNFCHDHEKELLQAVPAVARNDAAILKIEKSAIAGFVEYAKGQIKDYEQRCQKHGIDGHGR